MPAGCRATAVRRTTILLSLIALASAAPMTASAEPVIHPSRITGKARFIANTDGSPIVLQQRAAGSLAANAIAQFGADFGISDARTQLRQIKQQSDALGHTHTSYQQQHDGIDVFSGILRVHEDAAGSLVAMNGDFYPISPKLITTPAITEQEAVAACLDELQLGTADTESSKLVIVDPGWYGDPTIGAHLAYHIVLTNWPMSVREAFFVDAATGEILDRWTMLHTARVRQIHDGNGGGSLPGTLVRAEGDPVVASPEDVNRAYDYYQDVYDYFFNAFGRDSIDDNGLVLVATVNSTAPPCPNATWTGSQMVFCDGAVSDDIVGHELAHGVTQYSADLIYQNQPGQLNESFSDVFGELIDLYNGGAEAAGPPVATPFGNHPTGPGLDVPNTMRNTECSPSPTLEILSPAPIAGSYIAARANFGTGLVSTGITAEIVDAMPAEGCDSDMPFSNAAALNGAIALMDAGACDFTEQVRNAQDAGAIGAIIINANPGAPPTNLTGEDASIFITSLMISNADGALIRAQLATTTVTGTLKALGYANGVRWRMGEDAAVFGGAIRDMWNPPCDGDPDFANSFLQTCNPLDSGGVHSGSGIPNHAFAMLTDGKTFNGFTVNGIGPIKSGAVWYRALNFYLTPASDFDTAYLAFLQAANDLVGMDLNDPRTGLPSGNVFTAADVLEVDKALLAVEMNTDGACGASDDVLRSAEPTRCADRVILFADDFESGAPGWSVSNSGPPTPYDWILTIDPLPSGATGIAWFCDDADVGDCGAQDESATHSLMSPVIALPANAAHPRLSFLHLMGSEGAWDGGNLKINVNAGGWQVIPRSAYEYNPTNAPINTAFQNNTNPLAGEPGWTGAGGTWGRSVANLSGLAAAGDNVQFRFDFGKDGCTGGPGWYVDEFEVYNCIDCDNDANADIDQVRFAQSTNTQGNIGTGSPQAFVIIAPPVASTDVSISVQARGDFSASTEYVDVDINGTILATMLATNASDCPGTPDIETAVIPSADFNLAVGGGNATITLTATGSVNPTLNNGQCRGESFIAITIEYGLAIADCDNDGSLDACQLSAATIADFVSALLQPTGDACLFDVNDDGNVDGLDIQGFVANQIAP